MLSKLRALLWLILFAVSSYSAIVFGQKASVDKTTLTRYEKSIEAGKTAEMERSLFDLALANPNNPQVLELLAKLRARQNRVLEAAALYKRVLALDANSASARINLALLLSATGKADEARQTLETIDEKALSDQTLRLKLAETFLIVNEPQKALGAIEKLSLKIKNTDALPIIAASYVKLNEREKLRDLLAPMMRAAVVNPILAKHCAEILQKAGMRSEAVDLLRAAFANAPNNFDILILLAKLEIAQRSLAAAKQHLNLAAGLQPRSAKTFFAQAMFEEASGNLTASFESLKQARLKAPAAPEILAQFVMTALRANDPRAAVEAAQKLVETQPDEPENLYLLGAAFLQSNNTVEAERNLQRFAELRPSDPRGCLALGLTLAAQNDKIEIARRQLGRCIEIDGSNFEALYQLGLSYKTEGDNAKAVQYLEQTIETAPNYAPALRDLGALYLQSGAESKAQIVLEKAVALDPDDADTHFQLSRLYNLTGESTLSKRHLEIFQKLKSGRRKSL